MINASVAKLNLHVGDPSYDRVIEEINAAQEEGLQSFDIDVHTLETSIIFDLSRALSDMGYLVDHNHDADTLEITYDE